MKHIKRKFLVKIQASSGFTETFNNLALMDSSKKVDLQKIDFKEMKAWGVSEKNEIISMFQLRDGKKTHLLPEPDLVLCLFELGRQNAIKIPELRKRLIRSAEEINTHDTFVNLNNFYAATSSSAIFLINALESFVNRIIPEEFKYEVKTQKNTISYDKKQIERNISFEEKLKKVIPQSTGKEFHKKYHSHFNSIMELKTLRDEMTHMKSFNETIGTLSYEEIYNMAFKINYIQSLDAVKTYINFYTEGLIEPCPCGMDY